MRISSFEKLRRFSYFPTGSNLSQKPFKKKSSKWAGFLIIFFVVLFLVFLASLTGFLVFNRQVIEFKTESILIEFEGPDKIEVGQNANFSISVKNKERVELKDVELRVEFPNSFYLKGTTEPCVEKFASGCVWDLKRMPRLEKKNVGFNGYFLSPSSLKFNVFLNFKMVGFSANFKKQIEKEVLVTPALNVDLIAPSTIFQNQESNFEVVIENKTENEIKNVEIKLEMPSDFKYSFFSPDNQLEENFLTLSIPILKAKEKKSNFFSGYFKETGEQRFKVETFLLGEDDRLFTQKVIEKTLIVEPNNFYCQFLIEENLEIDWGKEVPLSFVYKNEGEDNFEDVFLKLTFNQPEYIDWPTTLHSGWQWHSGEKNISTNLWQISEEDQKKILIWQSSQIPALKKIKGGEGGEIKMFLKLIPYPPDESFYKKFEIIIDLEVSGNWENGAKIFIKTEPIKLKIKNNL